MDGLLQSGSWGGAPEPTALSVNADGTASLDLDCIGGFSAEPVLVQGGVVRATFSFDPDSWGPDLPGDEVPYEVVLDGTVCGQRFDGVASSDDARFDGPQTLVLVLGATVGSGDGCAQ